MEKEKSRILWIAYLKAFACFLVVLGHLMQSLIQANIDKNANIATTIGIIIYLFHMPLFMCLSGYLYCMKNKKLTLQEYKKFEIKKIINLSIPYFVFYILYVVINVIFSTSVNNPKKIEDLVNIFNNPISPYWFLYALLSIFIVVPILEKICKYNQKYVLAIFLILKVLSFYIKSKIYIIYSIMNWGIYFYLGAYFIKKERINKKINTWKMCVYICIYIGLGILYSIYYSKMSQGINEIVRLFFAIAGIDICIKIFKNINKIRILDTFKNYTFQIYLTHTIFAAGFRIVLLKIGITSYFVHFVIGLLASIYIPVLLAKIFEKTKYLNFFFYPIKTIEELKLKKGNDLQ